MELKDIEMSDSSLFQILITHYSVFQVADKPINKEALVNCWRNTLIKQNESVAPNEQYSKRGESSLEYIQKKPDRCQSRPTDGLASNSH